MDLIEVECQYLYIWEIYHCVFYLIFIIFCGSSWFWKCFRDLIWLWGGSVCRVRTRVSAHRGSEPSAALHHKVTAERFSWNLKESAGRQKTFQSTRAGPPAQEETDSEWMWNETQVQEGSRGPSRCMTSSFHPVPAFVSGCDEAASSSPPSQRQSKRSVSSDHASIV